MSGKYGEPWSRNGRNLRTARFYEAAEFLQGDDLDRALDCVNAFAGTEDPAAEIARLRKVEVAARGVLRANDNLRYLNPKSSGDCHAESR